MACMDRTSFGGRSGERWPTLARREKAPRSDSLTCGRSNAEKRLLARLLATDPGRWLFVMLNSQSLVAASALVSCM